MISEGRRKRLFARRIQARPWALAWPLAMTPTEIKKQPGDVIVFSDDSIRSTAMPQDALRAIHRPQTTGDPLSGPLEIKTGSGF